MMTLDLSELLFWPSMDNGPLGQAAFPRSHAETHGWYISTSILPLDLRSTFRASQYRLHYLSRAATQIRVCVPRMTTYPGSAGRSGPLFSNTHLVFTPEPFSTADIYDILATRCHCGTHRTTYEVCEFVLHLSVIMGVSRVHFLVVLHKRLLHFGIYTGLLGPQIWLPAFLHTVTC